MTCFTTTCLIVLLATLEVLLCQTKPKNVDFYQLFSNSCDAGLSGIPIMSTLVNYLTINNTLVPWKILDEQDTFTHIIPLYTILPLFPNNSFQIADSGLTRVDCIFSYIWLFVSPWNRHGPRIYIAVHT